MATPERIRKARGDAAAAAAPTAPAESKQTPAEDLNNAETQQKILSPETLQITVGGAPIMLHALPAKVARAFTALADQVLRESVGRGASTAIGRMTGVLAGNPAYFASFCEYTARATYSTAAPPTGEELGKETARIDDGLKYAEISVAWDAMILLNDVGAALLGKK